MYLKILVVLFFAVIEHGAAFASDERFSTWTTNIVAQAQAEALSVDSPDAARLWAYRNVMTLYNESLPPYPVGIGVIESGPYNIMLRVWDDEDFGVIDESFGQMIELLRSVRELVGGDFPDAEHHNKMLNVYRDKLRELGSPKAEYDREILNSFKEY